MADAIFRYTPIAEKPDFGITEEEFLEYLKAPGTISVLEALVLNQLDEALVQDGKKDYSGAFGFKVTRSDIKSRPTSWKEAYKKFYHFLEIRADESRASRIEGMRLKKEFGYCILVKSVIDEIEKRVKKATSFIKYSKMNWPRRKAGELLREVIIPSRDYSEINKENAEIAKQVRMFRSSLEAEVTKVYESLQQGWLTAQTGYDRDKMPAKEESPIKRLRPVGKYYTFVQLIREDKGNYNEVLNIVLGELQTLEKGSELKVYETIKDKGEGLMVSIKSLKKRVDNLFVLTSDVRYSITP